MAKQTFYDQWHRIAELRIGLRPSVQVRQQRFRGEVYYVYNEVIHAGFFRARPETHALVQRIRPNQTLHEIWREFVDISPKTAPGQKDFFDLIAALYRANMVYVEGGVSEERLLERALQKKKKPLATRISELLFLRIPLLDPEPMLKRLLPLINVIYSLPAILLVLGTCLWAGYEFLLASDRAFAQSQNILQISNLIPLYLAMFATHVLHEFSHAALCKYYGGHVRTTGLMLLMFTPLPYADVSASWSFRNKWHRAAVGAAGMYSDAFFCAIATIVWAYSPPGPLNEVATNLMFVTAVYTVLFNANPLMRFDGYYILSDITGIPNLHEAAKKQVTELFRTKILGEAETQLHPVSGRRKFFLAAFFFTSNFYRILIMIGIVKFVADQYFGLGLAVAVALAYSTFLAPVAKFLKPVRDPRFMAKHRKKVLGAGSVFLAMALFIAFVPLPFSRVLDGVVQDREKTRIFLPLNGIVKKVYPQNGDHVAQGAVVMQLSNPELELELQGLQAKITGVEARMNQSLTEGGQTYAAIEQELQTMQTTRAHLESELRKLVIYAPHDGTWVAPELRAYTGQWLSRGAEVGAISKSQDYQFRAILEQQGASEIAAMRADEASVKVEGLRAHTLAIPQLSVIPFSQKELPSVAVSPLAGGDVAMDLQNRDKPEAAERFFLIVADLASDPVDESLLDGRRGWMRVSLPPRSLGLRAYDGLRQFFQKRYKL